MGSGLNSRYFPGPSIFIAREFSYTIPKMQEHVANIHILIWKTGGVCVIVGASCAQIFYCTAAPL